jgi:hypothetical protein
MGEKRDNDAGLQKFGVKSVILLQKFAVKSVVILQKFVAFFVMQLR